MYHLQAAYSNLQIKINSEPDYLSGLTADCVPNGIYAPAHKSCKHRPQEQYQYSEHLVQLLRLTHSDWNNFSANYDTVHCLVPFIIN